METRYNISDIFRLGRAEWPGGLSDEQYSVLNLIAQCRTGVLGELECWCNRCGYSEVVPQSCGNRHCPNCLESRQAKWSERVCRRLPAAKHFHMVFTVPPELAEVMRAEPKAFLGLFFEVVAEVLKTFAKNNWKGDGGFLAVLHTWGQTLQWHPHLHVLVSGGRLDHVSGRWKKAPPRSLHDIRNLSKVYRGIFLNRLEKLGKSGTFPWPAHLKCGASRAAWLRRLSRPVWRIHIEPPLRHTRAVVRYLARYTSRVAISNQRIVEFDPEAATVRFSYKDNRQGGRRKEMTLPVGQFTARFAQHILPKGFQRIRYFGFLNPGSAHYRSPALPSATAQLERAFERHPCPRCGNTNWTHLPRSGSLGPREGHPPRSPSLQTPVAEGFGSVSLLSSRAPPGRGHKPVQQVVGVDAGHPQPALRA